MTYDAVGNLTFDSYTNPGKIDAMTYDAENHMTSAANGGQQYRYNADGKRVKRTVTGTGGGAFWMVYGIGGELVAEYNASSGIPLATAPSKEFGYRGGQMLIIAEGSNPKWLIQDHLGSTRMEIGLSGAANAVTRHDFLPFGEELAGAMRSGNGYGGATNTKHRFTGYQRDTETGLDFAQARYMSSLQGRFTSVDPDNAGAVFDDPQSWNAYAYVGNHPTTTTDPSGLVWAWHGVSRDLHWFDTRGEYNEAVKLDKNWVIVDGQDFFVTRSGSPQNPNHDYLRSGHRYTLYADGAVFDANAPYYNAAGALARQMQLRAAATKQAIGIVAKLNLEPVLIIFGGEVAYAFMYGTGITSLGLKTVGLSASSVEVAIVIAKGLANPSTRGLTQQLLKHQEKLLRYIKDPLSMDNKGFLTDPRNAARVSEIIKSRYQSVIHQIKDFYEQIVTLLPKD